MLTDDQHVYRASQALVIFAWTVLLGATPATLHASADPCTTIVPLIAGETWRDPGRAVDEVVCFDLDVESSGFLALDLVTSSVSTDPTAPRAWLVFDGPGRLQQSATSLVLAASPSSYRVRVEAADTGEALPPFRLATRFVADVAKSETDSEIEVEPDPFAAPTPEVHDLSRPSRFVRQHLAELCRYGSGDDHGDSFLCATALAWDQTTDGEIGNDWGDDSDVFRFRVETLGPVEIEARGKVELAVELYDRYGQRLAVAAGGSSWPARTLVPGTYFVRSRSRAGSEGSYSMRVGRSRR